MEVGLVTLEKDGSMNISRFIQINNIQFGAKIPNRKNKNLEEEAGVCVCVCFLGTLRNAHSVFFIWHQSQFVLVLHFLCFHVEQRLVSCICSLAEARMAEQYLVYGVHFSNTLFATFLFSYQVLSSHQDIQYRAISLGMSSAA